MVKVLGCGMVHPNVLKNAKVTLKNIKALHLVWELTVWRC